MINLPTHEDDIYINALIQIHTATRDMDLPFDLDAYRSIRQIVTAEISDRLGEMFFDEAAYPCKRIDPANELFVKAWASERGLNCTQSFDAAAHQYNQALTLGSVEAKFRLAWLYENGLVFPQNTNHTKIAELLYREAADAGHVKSLIACGQRTLFSARSLDSLFTAQEFFHKANCLDPLSDYLYLDVITEIIEVRQNGGEINVADHLEYILPIIGHMKKGESVHYQRGIESNLRLARYLYEHQKRTGAFFLSWCYLNGVGLPLDRDMGLRLATEVYDKRSGVSNYFLAWAYLSTELEIHMSSGLHFLALAAKTGLCDARTDWDILVGCMPVSFRPGVNVLKASNKVLMIISWFGFRNINST